LFFFFLSPKTPDKLTTFASQIRYLGANSPVTVTLDGRIAKVTGSATGGAGSNSTTTPSPSGTGVIPPINAAEGLSSPSTCVVLLVFTAMLAFVVP